MLTITRKTLKVIQVVQCNQRRGAEVFASQLASELMAQCHRVTVVSIFPSPESPLLIQECVGKRGGFFGKVNGLRRLAQIIKNQNPDVVQCNAGDTLKHVVFSKLLFRWKTPIVMRNASMISSYLRSRYAALFYRFLYRHVAAIASVSTACLEDLTRSLDLPKIPCKVIPIALFDSTASPIQFPISQIPIVHVGGFTFEKNHTGLLRIFKQTLATLPAAHLHLVGDGPLRPIIEKEIASQRLQKHVTLHGYQPNPLDYMAGAKAVVLPSIIEGLPAVILEAMSVKTPVIAYDVGGIQDLVIPNETGYLIPKNQEAQFSQTLIQCLREPNSQMIDSAYQLAHTKFSIQHIAQQFLDLYQEVL